MSARAVQPPPLAHQRQMAIADRAQQHVAECNECR
jgi:hypothetical protein